MTFGPVVGQAEAVRALQAHLRRTGGAGSTLLVGPEGVGRFLLAHCAARAILGTSRAAALRAERLDHVDLHVPDLTQGIDAVRDVRALLARRPAEGPRAVLILRDADRMSTEALNALLKTLEEPPADAAVFIVAEAPEFLPETVVSRCRIVRARALSAEDCRAVLRRLRLPEEGVADAEGSPGRAVFLAEAGVPGDADRLLALMAGPVPDPLAEAERLARRRPGEEGNEHRRRLGEVLRVAAARLRRDLPGTETRLHAVVEALGSLRANANAAIVLADLALMPWKTTSPAATRPTPRRT